MIPNVLTKIWAVLTPRQRRLFCVLVAVNTIAAITEVIGVLSLLPFLVLVGNPALMHAHPVLSKIYEAFGFRSDSAFLVAAGIGTIAAILVTNLIGIGSLVFRTIFCTDIVNEMTGRLFRGYLAQPYHYFLRNNSSVLAKDVLTEVQNFYNSILEPVTTIIARGLQVLFIAMTLLLLDWRIALAAAVVLGGFYLVSYAVLRKRIDHLGRVRWRAMEYRNRLVSEALAGMKELRLFGREAWYADTFDNESVSVNRSNARLSLYGLAPRYLIEVLVSAGLIVIVLFGIRQGDGLLALIPTLGVFAAAGVRMMPSIQLLFQYVTMILGHIAVVDRVAERLREINGTQGPLALSEEAITPLRLTRNLEVDGVSYRYSSDGPLVVDNVSLEINAGACVGICGPSGAGKTTLVDLCLGLLRPTVGRVIIDQSVLDDRNTPGWQRNIGYVPQAIYLIDGTIAENIAFATNPGRIDMAAVRRAANLARLDEFVQKQSDAYETKVGERGVRLSGGQRQRIAIARALYHDPDVLLFDEATSALDSDNEAYIVDAIQSLAHKKTILIVAHRHSTLRYCDVIYEMRDGQIRKTCSYEELVAGLSVGS